MSYDEWKNVDEILNFKTQNKRWKEKYFYGNWIWDLKAFVLTSN